jgi:uncharacterized protein YjlB
VGVTVETYTFDDDGRIPNSRLPVVVHDNVPAAHDAARCEELLGGNTWVPDWRNGIFSFHHFHSTTHEALGIVAGEAEVMLGGPSGRRFGVGAGQILVLPAGTGHCNLGSSLDLLVIGAYPDGRKWDLRRGDPAEREEVLENIRKVPPARADPVEGPDGPLMELWREQS